MARPVIGICTALERARWSVWDQQAYLLPRSYIDAVQRAGGIALHAAARRDASRRIPTRSSTCSTGSSWPAAPTSTPRPTGSRPTPRPAARCPERDDFEIALTRRALERDLPLLGICRGMQVMNVAAGGTLLQHLPESHGHHEHRRNPGSFDGADHDVRLSDGSLAARAAGEVVHGTKSHHHQAVDRVGEGFEVTGWSSIDELPEAFEAPDRRFALGVQWHPEADEQQPPDRRPRGRGRRRAQRLALMSGSGGPSAARRTVLVALAANASIAVAKLVAGLASGSSAMLAEAAHSIADTMNQVFLLFSLALGERPPDAEHPFGHGKERFFWSFLAAVGIFVAGAGFSLYEGLQPDLRPARRARLVRHRLRRPRLLPAGRRRVARARMAPDARARPSERRQPYASYVRASRDPTTKTVLFEDSARGHRRRPGLRGRRDVPGHRQPGLRRPGLGARSACCWRWSPWPSVATPRTCSSARRRRPRSARRSPRSSRPIRPSTACSSC